MSRISSSGYRDTRCPCLWEVLVPVTRFWGVATAVVLSGVGADITARGHLIGLYAIVASIVVFFLEITWAITLFLRLCIKDLEDGCGWTCWSVVLWISGWKKAILYVLMSAIPIAFPCKLWLSYVAGGQLIVLAIFHLTMCLRKRHRPHHKDSLLPQYGDADSVESCRFEEVLDDTLPQALPERRSLQEDQDLILEI